jgi:hypothetical protein
MKSTLLALPSSSQPIHMAFDLIEKSQQDFAILRKAGLLGFLLDLASLLGQMSSPQTQALLEWTYVRTPRFGAPNRNS